MLVHGFIDKSASRYPDKVAVIHDDQRISYRQLASRINGLASHLKASGIVKGDRIALLFENSVEYIVAYYAAIKAGAGAAPLNQNVKPDNLKYLLNDLEPAAVIAGSKSERLLKATDLSGVNLNALLLHNPKQVWQDNSFSVISYDDDPYDEKDFASDQEIDESDIASIIYTSGSTGKPKGVMLSHQNIVSNTESICQYLQLSEKDIQMVVLPFFYVMGKSLLNTHMATGGTLVLNNKFMYPADVIHQMIEEKVTGFSGVPSTYAYLLNRSPLASCKDKLSELRYCSQAGGHMAKSQKIALKKALPDHTDIVIMYGATEAAARLTYLDPIHFNSKLDSIGKPIPGVTVRVLDEDGNDVPDESEGELVASGANIMLGYWNDTKATSSVISEHGYHTGDIGFRDTDGFLFAVRRKDGLLKVGGHRVNPTEIEDAIMATDVVIEATVIGLPDSLLGNKLVAIIVPKEDGFEPAHLLGLLAAELPKHKCPDDIVSMKTLPKNANGKINKEACREMALKSIVNNAG